MRNCRPLQVSWSDSDTRFTRARPARPRPGRCASFIAFKDPTGNSIELVWRPAYSSRRYHGERDAGITGFSHIGLCTTDAARDEAFWTKVCNARVSDRIGDAALLRIDEVHHTIALFPTDPAGIQHINHQVESGDDVMRSFKFLSERRCPWCSDRDGTRLRRRGSSISRARTAWSSNIRRACARSPTSCSTASVSFRSIRRDSANGAQNPMFPNFATERETTKLQLSCSALETSEVAVGPGPARSLLRLHPSGRCPFFPFSNRNPRHRSRLIVSASRNGAAASHSAFKIAFGNSIARVMPRSVRTSTISY